MSLLQLPAELRLRIYDFLPSLAPGRHETVAPLVPLLPAISRTTRQLRKETIPIYAGGAHFNILLDDALHVDNHGLHVWLQTLGEPGLHQLRSVQLSRHWKLSQPSRWQGHVGFYVKLEKIDGCWKCTTGTYPIAKDMRGMRLESVELLQQIVQQNILLPLSSRETKALSKADFEMLLEAMGIVASHPISAHDLEQSEAGRKQRRQIWEEMERQLFALKDADGNSDGPRRFYTPY